MATRTLLGLERMLPSHVRLESGNVANVTASSWHGPARRQCPRGTAQTVGNMFPECREASLTPNGSQPRQVVLAPRGPQLFDSRDPTIDETRKSQVRACRLTGGLNVTDWPVAASVDSRGRHFFREPIRRNGSYECMQREAGRGGGEKNGAVGA